MNKLITFTFILLVGFFLYTRPNISKVLTNSIFGKVIIILIVIFLAENSGLATSVLVVLIAISLKRNVREGQENMDESPTAAASETPENPEAAASETPEEARQRRAEVAEKATETAMSLPDDTGATANTEETEAEKKYNVDLIVTTTMNKTDLERLLETNALINKMKAEEENDDEGKKFTSAMEKSGGSQGPTATPDPIESSPVDNATMTE